MKVIQKLLLTFLMFTTLAGCHLHANMFSNFWANLSSEQKYVGAGIGLLAAGSILYTYFTASKQNSNRKSLPKKDLLVTKAADNVQPVSYLFAHGLLVTKDQERTFKEHKVIGFNGNPVVSFDFPDVQVGTFNYTRANLAQDADLDCLAQNHAQISGDVVLCGYSRGASAVLAYAGRNKPKNIKGIIALAPFGSVQDVVQSFIKFGSLSWLAHKLGAVSLVLKKYDANGIKPIDVVNQIPADIPILLCASSQDEVVPVWSTCNIYTKLHQQGRNNIHIIVLENGGGHLDVLHDERFHQVKHAWARHYKLPHIKELADKGQALFEQSQPEPAALNKYQPWGWWLDGAVGAAALVGTYAKWGK